MFTPPGQFQCHGAYHIQAGQDSVQYLASIVTQQTECGFAAKPWVISAQHGQRMKLSLLDFSTNVDQNPPGNYICIILYGFMFDMHTDDVVNICGGVTAGVREVVLYETAGNVVQILLDRNAVDMYSFVIRYEGSV